MKKLLSELLGAVAGPIVGPVAVGVAVLLLLVALGQCTAAKVQSARADSAERRVAQVELDRDRCVINRKSLEDKVDAQNGSIAGLQREAAVRTAAAEKAVSEALRGRASAESRASKLLAAPPTGADACARAMSAFKTVKENLR